MTKQDFVEMILNNFQFLEEDYGFVWEKVNDKYIEYENDYVKLAILLDFGNMIISMKIQKEHAKLLRKDYKVPASIQVEHIIDCFDQTTNKIRKGSPISSDKINEYIEILNTRLNKFLVGDFSEWNIVSDCLRARR